MKNIFILGANGNMAKRYQAILKTMDVKVYGSDIGGGLAGIERADGIIIATPTDLHLQHLDALMHFRRPILCEKPLTKDLTKLHSFEERHGGHVDLIRMVNQYEFMTTRAVNGETEYDYFKTGADGIVWDCVNVLGLAKGNCLLSNQSPIWKCKINGQILDHGKVDKSYVDMMDDWVKNHRSNFQYAKMAHEKAGAWQKF